MSSFAIPRRVVVAAPSRATERATVDRARRARSPDPRVVVVDASLDRARIMSEDIARDVPAVARCLEGTLSADAAARASASEAIERCGSFPGFAGTLAKIALSPDAAEASTRQLSAVLLKKHVREHWNARDRGFVPPELTEVEKAELKAVLPSGLADGWSKMRTAFAAAIAQTVTSDGQIWNELTARLVDGIRAKRSREEVLGCLKCYEIIAGDVDARDIASVGPALFPELLTLARQGEDAALRRRAAGAFTSTVATLTSMSGQEQKMTRDVLLPYLPTWLETLAMTLERVPEPNNFDQCASTLEALSSLALAVQYFVKPAGDALMPALSRGAAMFHAAAPVWAAYAEETDHEDPGMDSDGDRVSFEAVVTELLELVINIAEQPKLQKLLEPSLADTVYITMGFMAMSTSQEEQWSDDPNQFIADEDDDFSTVRAACLLMLDSLGARFGAKAVAAVATATERRLGESIAARHSGDKLWWRGREAALLAVGTMNDTILASIERAREKGVAAPFDIATFLTTIIDTDLHESTAASVPFLRGRALWVAARLSREIPPDVANTVLRASVGSLAPNLAAPLRIGACRAIAEFLPIAKKEVTAPYIGDVYTGLGNLLVDAGEETLHLILEAMLVLIKADDTAAAAWLGALAPAVLKIWAEYVRDPLVSADTSEVFEALAAIPACQAPLHAMLVPTLSRILASPNEQPEMLVEATLDLLTIILRPATVTEAKSTHEACFKYVCGLILHSDDAGVMQGASEALRAFLRAGKEDMLAWGSGDTSIGGGDVLQAMFQAASRLLDPNLEDSASLYAAPLLCQMLRRLPNKVGPVLRDIVAAVVARLRSSTQPNLSASLLTVFARVAHVDAVAFVELLTSLPSGGDEPNALDFVMRSWVEKQPDVHGSFDIKLTTSALGLLLNTQHPALSAVVVNGALVETPAESGRIRTRARARTAGPEVWTQIPLPAKIVQLLADVLIEYAEGAAGADDDYEEWEEDRASDEDDALDHDDDDDLDRLGALTDLNEGFTGDLFARLLMRGGFDAFDPDDADEAEDPVNDVDLRAFVVDGFKSLHASGALAPLASVVDVRHQRAIHDALVDA